jgi:hypothetical protein
MEAICKNRDLDSTTSPIFEAYRSLADSMPISSLTIATVSFANDDDKVTAATFEYLARLSNNSDYAKLFQKTQLSLTVPISQQALAKAQLQALINAIMADVCKRNQCGKSSDEGGYWYWITIVVIIVVMLALVR